MANLREMLLRELSARKGPIELDLDATHLASLPPELKIFERNFRFVPVEHDPFPKPAKPKKGAAS